MNSKMNKNSESSNPWAVWREEQKQKTKDNAGKSKYIKLSDWADKESHLLTFSKYSPCEKTVYGKIKDSAEISVCAFDGEPINKIFNPIGRQLEALAPILEEYNDTQSVTVKFTRFVGKKDIETTYTAEVVVPTNE